MSFNLGNLNICIVNDDVAAINVSHYGKETLTMYISTLVINIL